MSSKVKSAEHPSTTLFKSNGSTIGHKESLAAEWQARALGGLTMAPEMTARSASELVQLLEDAGIQVWLDGGWAVDALVGEQTRPHKDLNIILHVEDLPKLVKVLSDRGFAVRPQGTSPTLVLANASGLEVDVRTITLDWAGNGVSRIENGPVWMFPADGFSGRGTINGIAVHCLSAEVQVSCHAKGCVLSEELFHDMKLLQDRFGVSLPGHLRRSGRA